MSAGRVEKEDIIAKIVKLSKHVDELKVEVHDTLQKNYVEFYPSLSMALELRTRVEKTLEEMELVANRVEKEVCSDDNIYSYLVKYLPLKKLFSVCFGWLSQPPSELHVTYIV